MTYLFVVLFRRAKMGFTVKSYGPHIFTVKCYKARIIDVNYTL